MARASEFTSLSLDRFAQIMSINPMHFNGATAVNVSPNEVMPIRNSCSDVYFQYAWQHADKVSREYLAEEIAQAEADIEEVLGYPVAPRWFVEESRQFPQSYRRDLYGAGFDVRGARKGVRLHHGKVMQAGQRAVTLLGTVTTAGADLVYSDADGDGYNETATLTLATTLTDAQEIKVYFEGQSGDEEWEVRPCRTKVISGGNVVITFWSWQLIDPDLWEALPTSLGASAVDISDDSNYVIALDIYREYNDNTSASVVFYWWDYCNLCDGSGCSACAYVTQDGCFSVSDPKNGMIRPFPATYDADNAVWTEGTWTKCVEPNLMKVWYRAGYLSQDYLKGKSFDPLDRRLARAIAYLATARLERDFCSCTNVKTLSEQLRLDVSRQQPGGASFYISPRILDNPFGTRLGEIRAWRLIENLHEKAGRVALV